MSYSDTTNLDSFDSSYEDFNDYFKSAEMSMQYISGLPLGLSVIISFLDDNSNTPLVIMDPFTIDPAPVDDSSFISANSEGTAKLSLNKSQTDKQVRKDVKKYGYTMPSGSFSAGSSHTDTTSSHSTGSSADFSRFRLSQNFGSVSGVKKQLSTVLVRKPNKTQWSVFILRKRWTPCSCHILKVVEISTWSSQSFKLRWSNWPKPTD